MCAGFRSLSTSPRAVRPASIRGADPSPHLSFVAPHLSAARVGNDGLIRYDAAQQSQESTSPPSGRIGLGILLLATMSVLCFGASMLASGRGSGSLYLGWFGALTIAGFVSGAMWPRCAIWGALLTTWSQSLFVYLQLAASGEIAQPSRSTGGMVTWGIVTVFLFVFSPVPAAASWVGKKLRLKPAQHSAAADDRPQAGDRA
jgi:hypothetical protein